MSVQRTAARDDVAAGGEPPRERILAAMGAQAGAVGLRAVRLEGLLAEAGVSRAEFDREFIDLDDCFLACWDRVNEEFLGRTMAAYARPAQWRDKVRAAAEELLAFADEDLPRARVLIVELLNAGPKGLPRRDMNIRAVTAIIDAGRGEMEDPEAVPHMVANTIAGSIYQTLYTVLASGEPFSTEELMEELMYVAVMPYLGVEAAMREVSSGGVKVAIPDACRWERMRALPGEMLGRLGAKRAS